VDFRCGINSLTILVERAMRLNPMSRALFVFSNRRGDRVKILGWDRNGFWLLFKRLEGADRFTWPDNETEVVTLSVELLHWLIDGADITALRRHRSQNYLHVS
jgi:transposase